MMEDQLFETIYEHTNRPLWAYVARISGDVSVADDILQETYLRFLNAPRSPSRIEEAKPYLFKIATNLVYDRVRSLKRRAESELTELPDRTHKALAVDVEFGQVFSRLTRQERVLLWLAYVEGYDHRQIAAIANVNRLSVKVLLFRARRRLAQLIKGEEV